MHIRSSQHSIHMTDGVVWHPPVTLHPDARCTASSVHLPARTAYPYSHHDLVIPLFGHPLIWPSSSSLQVLPMVAAHCFGPASWSCQAIRTARLSPWTTTARRGSLARPGEAWSGRMPLSITCGRSASRLFRLVKHGRRQACCCMASAISIGLGITGNGSAGCVVECMV